ncbi:MAG: hypothetical protein PHR04_05830 [Syntrophomonadaceae bacterium]|nr:hypothetical protein [Syntrophomonadaceae bacterium]
MGQIGDILMLFCAINLVFFLGIFVWTGRYLKRTLYWLIVFNIGFWIFYVIDGLGSAKGLSYNSRLLYWLIFVSVLGLGSILEKFFIKKRDPIPKFRYASNSGELLPEENGIYKLPLYQVSHMKWYFHLLFGLMEVGLLIFIFLFVITVLPADYSAADIVFIICASVVVILIGLLWIMQAVSNKPYLKITNDYIEYKNLFGKEHVRWNQIVNVEFYMFNGMTFLGITDNRPNKTFSQKTDKALGFDYSIKIPLSMFSSIDFEKLKATILSKSAIT